MRKQFRGLLRDIGFIESELWRENGLIGCVRSFVCVCVFVFFCFCFLFFLGVYWVDERQNVSSQYITGVEGVSF